MNKNQIQRETLKALLVSRKIIKARMPFEYDPENNQLLERNSKALVKVTGFNQKTVEAIY